MSDPRFPIGPFSLEGAITPERLKGFIDDIAAAPAQFRAAVANLSPAQLDTQYRSGGWTIRQVIHHVADSHMNSYVRFRLALTEDNPAIKPYDEARWADLHDAYTADVDISLRIIEAIHERWVLLVRSLSPVQWLRTFYHPERGTVRLDETAAMYSWHCKHHLAHITTLCRERGW